MREIIGILILVGIVTFSGVAESKPKNQKRELARKPAVLGIESNGENQGLYEVETHYGASIEYGFEQLVERKQITIFSEDKIKTFPDPRFGLGFVMQITRALPVKVEDGGKAMTMRTFAPTVKDFLAEKSIDLGEKDKISLALSERLFKRIEIIIVRVEETEIKIKKTIEYKTEYQDDPSIDRGIEKVARSGEMGEKELIYLSIRENGQEVKRELKKTEIVNAPINQIIKQGTKEVVYGTGTATWFGAPAMTAAHNSLPRGTMVAVTNLSNGKTVTVKIIGGGIQGRAIIDLSPDAFSQLAPLGTGVINVKVAKP